MELWTIVVTAGVGLFAGQLGAWLQSRRDAAAEQGRQAAETERLREQLAVSQQLHHNDRMQTDLLEWRERRLAVYGLASSAIESLALEANRVLTSNRTKSISESATAAEAAGKQLMTELDQTHVIGTKGTRRAADEVLSAAESLRSAIIDLDLTCIRLASEPAIGPDGVARRLHKVRRSIDGRTQEPLDDPGEVRLDRSMRALVATREKFVEMAAAWREAARAELGVPD